MQKTILGTGFLVVALIALPLHAATLNQTSSMADQMSSTTISSPEPPHFAKVIEDLPLMPGLQLVEDEDVLFASQGSGRIAETNAIGAVDIDDVYKFYGHSLPHLGWKSVDARTYVREHEQLRIDAHANQKITVVRFTVKPAT
jgi:hypothetical protein